MFDSSKPSTYSIDCHDVVQAVEWCPFEWSSQLLAVGTNTRVSVSVCRFQEEDKEVDGLEHEHLRDFQHGTRVSCIAWSPESSLTLVPKVVKFCTAGGDNKLRLISSHLKENDSIKVIEGHTDYINGVVFEPDKGNQMASVSDDHTCRIWNSDGSQVVVFPLGSPGMDIRWHPREPLKIMVAEKKGIIRFYNLLSQQPMMSLDCGQSPLMSADWCLGNPLKVSAVSESDLLLFDTSKSSRPIESKSVHSEGCRKVSWARSNEHLLATTGAPNCQVKVMHIKFNQMSVSSSLQVSNGLSWHYRLPIVAVGGDRKTHFWVIENA